jgi:hypothetical protein
MNLSSVTSRIQNAYTETKNFVSNHRQAFVGTAVALITSGAAYYNRAALSQAGSSLMNKTVTSLSSLGKQSAALFTGFSAASLLTSVRNLGKKEVAAPIKADTATYAEPPVVMAPVTATPVTEPVIAALAPTPAEPAAEPVVAAAIGQEDAEYEAVVDNVLNIYKDLFNDPIVKQ